MIQMPKPGIPAVADKGLLHAHFIRWLRDSLIAKVRERPSFVSPRTGAYTASAWEVVNFNPSGGTFTVILPVRSVDGDIVTLNNSTSDSTFITVAPGKGDTVEGALLATVWGPRVTESFTYDSARRDWAKV